MLSTVNHPRTIESMQFLKIGSIDDLPHSLVFVPAFIHFKQFNIRFTKFTVTLQNALKMVE